MSAPNLRGEPAADVLAKKLFEPGGPSQSAVSWSFPAAARPPRQLRASFWLWLIAVAAGLFETTLVVVDATAGEVGSAAEVAVGVTIRLLAFTGLVYLAAQLLKGQELGSSRLGGALWRVRNPVAGDRTDHLARCRRIAGRRDSSRGCGVCAVRGKPARAPCSDHRPADPDVPPDPTPTSEQPRRTRTERNSAQIG